MKLKVDQKQLLGALKTASKIASPRSPNPVFAMARVRATGGELTVSATNGVESAKVILPTNQDDEIDVACNTQGLTQLVGKLKHGEMTIDVSKDGFTVSLKQGTRRLRILAMPGSECPAMPTADVRGIRVNGPELAAAIDMVKHAANSSNERPELHGVHVDLAKGRAFATNGRVVAAATGYAWGGEAEFMIPYPALSLVAERLAEAGEDEAFLHLTKSHIFFETDAVTIVASRMDVKAPPYDNIVQDSGSISAELDPEVLADAVSAVSASAKVNSVVLERAVSLSIGTEKDGIVVAGAADTESCDTVPAECSGKGHVGLDAQYLISALRPCDGRTLLHFDGELDPVFVKCGNYIGLVMPVRI